MAVRIDHPSDLAEGSPMRLVLEDLLALAARHRLDAMQLAIFKGDQVLVASGNEHGHPEHGKLATVLCEAAQAQLRLLLAEVAGQA
jgi:hypothetical protein